MSYKTLLKDIKENNIKSLYLLYGNERYLIEKTIKELEKKYITKNNRDFNYTVIDGERIQVDSLINACETVPFMGEKRIVIAKETGCFTTKKSGIDTVDEERLINYFSNIPSSTCLVFIESSNIDKRKKVVKEIKKRGEIIEVGKLTRQELINWIQKKFKESNKKVSFKFIEEFIEIIGYEDKSSENTLYNIENEINKICNYMESKNDITFGDVEMILNKSVESNVFKLVDAVSEKDASVALKILNQLLINGEPEVRILHMIIRQFRLLNLTKLMIEKGYTTMAIAPKLSLPQHIVKKYVKQTNIFSYKEILGNLNLALETDKRIKTGQIMPRLGVEILIGQCCAV